MEKSLLEWRCRLAKPPKAGCLSLASVLRRVGLWPVAPGDADTDGDVDGADFARFTACLSGPGTFFATPPLCRRFDLDRDQDIDQSDFGVFQRCISGPDIPADPGCGISQ